MLIRTTKTHFHTSISPSLLCLFFLVALTLTLAGCAKEIQVLPVDEFRFTQQQVRKAALSEDAHLAAFIFEDASVSVWDINEKQERYKWHAEALDEASLHLISFSKNKAWMALTGHWSTTLINLRSGEVVGSWHFSGLDPGATASSVALSSIGDSALVGMTDGTVLRLDFDNGTALQYQHNTMKVLHVGYVSGNYAFSGGIDKHWFFWDLDKNEVLLERLYRSRVTASVLDDRAQRVFISDALNTHEILDLTSYEVVSNLQFMERFRFFRKGLFLENGDYLITTSPKSVVTLWNANSGEELASWEIKRYSSEATTHAITLNNDGDVVTLSSDGVLQSWDYRSLITHD